MSGPASRPVSRAGGEKSRRIVAGLQAANAQVQEDKEGQGKTMDRKTKAGNEMPLRTLGDDELSLVSGARHCRRRRRRDHDCCERREDGDALAPSPEGGAGSGLAPINLTVIQIVTGNSGPVSLLNILGIG
jgi:hypothetical protein